MKKLLFALTLILISAVGYGLPKYKSLEKLVTTAGTRVALSSTKLSVSHVVIKARSNNTGVVYVGGVDVAAANGYPLAAGAEVRLGDLTEGAGANELFNLAEVYLDAATNGDGVRVIYAYDRFKP